MLPQKIVRPKARRLNTKIPGAKGAYNKRLEQLFCQHRIIERMGEVHDSASSLEEAKVRLDAIDRETHFSFRSVIHTTHNTSTNTGLYVGIIDSLRAH